MTNCQHAAVIAAMIERIEETALLEREYAIKRTQTSYCSDMHDVARDLYKRGPSYARLRLMELVKFGLRDAFEEAVKAAGLTMADVNEAEIQERDDFIDKERMQVGDFIAYLARVANQREPAVPYMDEIESRLSLWCKRYADMRSFAAVLIGKDAPLEWIYDPEKEHCDSCRRLNGKVKRASFWKAAGVLPQNPPNPLLKCGGWRCGCELRPTNKPLTRGGLPKLP